jgi:hypothetical protein
LTADCLPYSGGVWNYAAVSGVFFRGFDYAPSGTVNFFGARAVRLLAA